MASESFTLHHEIKRKAVVTPPNSWLAYHEAELALLDDHTVEIGGYSHPDDPLVEITVRPARKQTANKLHAYVIGFSTALTRRGTDC